jgi:hypothetical protein
MKKERPLELWVLIFFIVFYVIIQLVMVRYIYLNPDIYYNTAIYGNLIAAFIGFVLFFGFFKGYLWTWYIAVIAFVSILFYSIYNFLYNPLNFFNVLMIATGLYILFRPSVRDYFKK